MSKDTGGPAFPSVYEWRNDSDMINRAPNGIPVPPGCSETIHEDGMTLRDDFAAKAMQAYAAAHPDYNTDDAKFLADKAYRMADAMLMFSIAAAQSQEHLLSGAYRIDAIAEAECLANGRLIAAAPELLEALRWIVKYADSEPDGGEKVEMHRANVERARAAIAKAEGA